jgi:hypothetical protein
MKKFNLGTGSNNQTGDDGKTVGLKLNSNFQELFLAAFGQDLWSVDDEKLIDLSLLETVVKTSLLHAVNEVNKKGLKVAKKINLVANTPVEYVMQSDSYLMAVDFSGTGILKIGSSSGLEDYGDLEGNGVLSFSFLKASSIWLEASSLGVVDIIVFNK